MEHRLHRSMGPGFSGRDREDRVAMSMELLERLNYAEMKLYEAKQRNDDIEREYWLGYIDGVRTALHKEEPTRHMLAELYRAMREK